MEGLAPEWSVLVKDLQSHWCGLELYSEGKLVAHINMKWDGCVNVTWEPGPLHVCGPIGLGQFTRVFEAVFILGLHLIEDRDNSEEEALGGLMLGREQAKAISFDPRHTEEG